MVTISPISSIGYYTDLAAEDYYLAGGEPPGRWAGTGSMVLGLQGEVDPGALSSLMTGHDQHGQQLCDNAGSDQRRAGWDVCVSPPKTVSVAMARASGDLRTGIHMAHQMAVREAIEHLESRAVVTRRGHNGCAREPISGLVCAMFEHTTSRELDPQLHTHALILNAGIRDDGSWGTIESRDLYLWRRTADAVYKASLAASLQELGFGLDVSEDCKTFEISGIPPEISEHFSKRTTQIVNELRERGMASSSSRGGDMVTLGTRAQKTEINRDQLNAGWAREMDQLGFLERDLVLPLTQTRENNELWLDEHVTPALDTFNLMEVLTENKAVFEEREIYQKAAELALGDQQSVRAADNVARALLRGLDIVPLGTDYRHSRLFTSTSQLAVERDLVGNVRRLGRMGGFALLDSAVSASIDAYSLTLSDEQNEAVFDLCEPNRFAILQGSAGVGKSSTMSCVRMAYESSEFTVIGASIAKSAADNLGREAGIKDTFTVAKLISDLDRGRLPLTERTVLIIDEAGQAGSRQLATLAKHAVQSGSKLILVGDDKQLDAIQHGGMLRYLSRPEILGTSRIETIRRQSEPWARQAVADLRDGNAEVALNALNDRGMLNFSKCYETAHEALVEKWSAISNSEPSSSLLVVAQRWRDVELLSNRIRDILVARGEVQRKSISFNCITGNHSQTLEFSVSDRIRFTKNDYKLGLTNGCVGELIDLQALPSGDHRFTIREDSGTLRRFTARNYCDDKGRLQMTHAYASTVYASQGLTVDKTLILHDPQMDRASAYVAGSRHREESHWFINTSAIDEYSELGCSENQIRRISEGLNKDRYDNVALDLYERQVASKNKIKINSLQPHEQ